MGVNPLPTGGIYKYFTFDGETSASYGVHITGEGVFNAPKRAVEMVNIPARNGAFALDQGYFENIEVTYNASIVADTNADFAAAVSALRNFLCSRTGYCRLEDDYNPNEYRMAVYKSGLDVTPFVLKTGEFNITFDCKPQRFLKSGETAITVTSGDTITNPTLFDAKPQLQLNGYGTVSVNGADLTIKNVQLGIILISPNQVETVNFPSLIVLAGDPIYPEGTHWVESYVNVVARPGYEIVGAPGKTFDGVPQYTYHSSIYSRNAFSVVAGTATNSGVTLTQTYSIQQIGTSTVESVTYSWTFRIRYDGVTTITTSIENASLSGGGASHVSIKSHTLLINPLVADSTASALGNPMYIDFDIGEAYKEQNGEILSVNNYVKLPAELPSLNSGANTITFDNTFTYVKVVPRWWQV